MLTTSRAILFAALLGTAGLGVGAGVGLAPVPLVAEEATSCEDDECEGGSYCSANPQGNTSCDVLENGPPWCKTKACPS